VILHGAGRVYYKCNVKFGSIQPNPLRVSLDSATIKLLPTKLCTGDFRGLVSAINRGSDDSDSFAT
ncbi:MAG: hypothetical protein ACFE8Z_03970, partial [Candidatus Hermodarchaeota archaeon]